MPAEVAALAPALPETKSASSDQNAAVIASFLGWTLVFHMVPVLTLIGPWYIAFRELGLYDTRTALVLTHMTINLPMTVWLMSAFFREIPPEIEEAATSLGANRWQTVTRVILPSLVPALLTGLALAFARAVGEYGSVIFIAGNLPNVSEIAPLLIVIRLSEFRYADATAIAVVMLVAAFLIIFVVDRLQRWAQTRLPMH